MSGANTVKFLWRISMQVRFLTLVGIQKSGYDESQALLKLPADLLVGI
jgi:hypothetical protein